jgi:hypothetical protein
MHVAHLLWCTAPRLDAMTCPLCCHSVVYAATFTAEGMGRRVITGGHDKCICVWNAGTGAFASMPLLLARPRERIVLRVVVPRACAGQLLQRMRHIHVSFVLGLSCRFDGLQFASASGDHTIGACCAALYCMQPSRCGACPRQQWLDEVTGRGDWPR